MEEAGLRLNKVEAVVRAWSMPGISTERMDLFLAAYETADRVADFPQDDLACFHKPIVNRRVERTRYRSATVYATLTVAGTKPYAGTISSRFSSH